MRIMKLLLIGLVFLVSVSLTYAVPEIAYTNFARTAGGGLVLNSTVDVRITIFNSGTQVYQEIHTAVPTNGYGLFTVDLGTGAPVGPDTYNSIIAVNSLNVQAETNDGGGYRFVQLSPLLNTALKNEEAAGIVTLNDAYLNGDSIAVLPGAPITLTGTGLIQSDATIAAINANGNKTLTTKGYVDAADALISANPFLVWEPAGADLPNAKVLNGETNVINFNAATANLSILNDGISEPKLKMANDPANGYIIKWNGTDMTWVDPTVFTALPIKGDGTAANPIALNYVMPFILNGSNLDLKYDATLLVHPSNGLGINLANPNSWTGKQTFADVDINGGTIDGTVIGASTPAAGTFTTLVVNTNANVGTDLIVGNDASIGNDLDVIGNTNTNTLDVVANATVGGDLDVTGTTTSALFVGQLDKEIVNGDGIATFMYDNTNDATVAFDYNFYNEWFVTQTISPTSDEPALIANNTGFFNKTSTTATSFALQGYAQGQISTIPDFPTVAQGLTGIGQYTGAAPSTNMAIGTVGLTYPGNGAIAVGVYGGARENNNVANVGTVGHAYNDASGLQDMNHGVVGMVSSTPGASAEIGAALALNLNSGVTGINLGVNANDWAGYFIGNVKATTYYGALQYSIIDGPGIKDFSFNNTGAATVEVDYDATLKIDGTDKLGFDLAHSNTWTADQYLPATLAQGNNLVDAANMATNQRLNGDVVNYDATLEVTANELGIDLDHSNTWTVDQFFATIYADEYRTTNSYLVVGEALNTAYANVWDNGVAVLELGRGNGAGSNYGIKLNDNTGAGTRAGIGHNGASWVAGVGDLAGQNGAMMTWTSNSPNEARILVANGNLLAPVFAVDAEGDVFATTYTGQLIHSVTGGAGLANVTFDNTADIAFAVNVAGPVVINSDNVTLDYDATLEVNGTELGIDLDHSNLWTADQFLPATNLQGNNLVAAVNVADANSLNADVLKYDATLEVNGNELGFNHDHLNTWFKSQEFSPVADEYAILIDGTNAVSGYALMAIGNPFLGDDDFYFEGQMYVNENLNVAMKTTTNELDVTLDATIGDDLIVTDNTNTNSLDVTLDATVGQDLTVTGVTNLNGNVNIGSDNTDLVVFNGLVDSDIIPDENNVHSLGSSTLRWNDLYLGPGTLHIGNDLDEGTISYDVVNDEFDFDQNVNVAGTVFATTLNGGYQEGSVLFADASGNLTETINLAWDNAFNQLVLNGGIFIPGGNVAYPELWINQGQGIVLDGNATLQIEDYKFPASAGNPTDFLALKAPAVVGDPSDLEWWNYDNTILVDTLNKTIGVDMSAAFTFTNLVAFNPASGSAISATSSDPSAPTVTIEHTNPLGVALELVGAEGQTTALEVTTGGVNIANGQFIVSSNSGVTGSEPNGPSITVNNNGDGVSENGGALQILVGHTSFSYGSYAPANNAPVDLTAEPYTVLDVDSDGTNAVTLPNGDMAANISGTIIYVINSGTGTLTLPGTLGNVAAGASAQLVYTNNGWFRLN